ncbi:hypothetical protein DM02DRAFT_69911 [Periconia macrospinosa]|uniref:Uncharacterized protein n=1 Tax=Periconia macrospinosa TaxID=97972 RepID=A0A2V1E7R9_9PLEO|nr:hypothetical protein DM02DRAFT_69911 [Periconia macrospinosa]
MTWDHSWAREEGGGRGLLMMMGGRQAGRAGTERHGASVLSARLSASYCTLAEREAVSLSAVSRLGVPLGRIRCGQSGDNAICIHLIRIAKSMTACSLLLLLLLLPCLVPPHADSIAPSLIWTELHMAWRASNLRSILQNQNTITTTTTTTTATIARGPRTVSCQHCHSSSPLLLSLITVPKHAPAPRRPFVSMASRCRIHHV